MKYKDQEIRQTVHEGEIYYRAADIAKAAGHKNPSQSIQARCDKTILLQVHTQSRKALFINEKNALWLSAGTRFGTFLYNQLRKALTAQEFMSTMSIDDFSVLAEQFDTKSKRKLLIQLFLREKMLIQKLVVDGYKIEDDEIVNCPEEYVYEAYSSYCSVNGLVPDTKKQFDTELKELGIKRKVVNGYDAWVGIEFKKEGM